MELRKIDANVWCVYGGGGVARIVRHDFVMEFPFWVSRSPFVCNSAAVVRVCAMCATICFGFR